MAKKLSGVNSAYSATVRGNGSGTNFSEQITLPGGYYAVSWAVTKQSNMQSRFARIYCNGMAVFEMGASPNYSGGTGSSSGTILLFLPDGTYTLNLFAGSPLSASEYISIVKVDQEE